MLYEEWIKCFENVVRSHLGAYRHRQRLPRELIQNNQHLVAAAIAELVVDEVSTRQIASQSPDEQWTAQTWFGCVRLSRMIELYLK